MTTVPPPVLPESAPFTPEQRGWLNGYIAALTSGTIAGGALQAPSPTVPPALASPPSPSLPPVTILWGSQTGNAEGLARKASKQLSAQGSIVTVFDMANYPVDRLSSEEVLLIITSTYGDGEPPDNTADFHAFLHSAGAPKFASTRFAVFALGDSDYPDFCACGQQIDARLEELGAERLTARVDADVDFDTPFAAWQTALLEHLSTLAPAVTA